MSRPPADGRPVSWEAVLPRPTPRRPQWRRLFTCASVATSMLAACPAQGQADASLVLHASPTLSGKIDLAPRGLEGRRFQLEESVTTTAPVGLDPASPDGHPSASSAQKTTSCQGADAGARPGGGRGPVAADPPSISKASTRRDS